ncbi:hypothetical protein CL614_05935 [archaeon]|nr:hypothetical protein [archaeon]|tara:strand:+ start:152 stop:1168 length:1017 start_codon:yes stop_codon:yes gene_type:complete
MYKQELGGPNAVKMIAKLCRNFKQAAEIAFRKGNRYVYVPAAIEDSENILKLLKTPTGIFMSGRGTIMDSSSMGETVYSSLPEARNSLDSNGLPNSGFLEIDIMSKTITDFIDIDGISIIPVESPIFTPQEPKVVFEDQTNSAERLIQKINAVEGIISNYEQENLQKKDDTSEFFYRKVLEKIDKIEDKINTINNLKEKIEQLEKQTKKPKRKPARKKPVKKKRKPVKRKVKRKTTRSVKKIIKKKPVKKKKPKKRTTKKKLPTDINQQEVTNLILIKELQNLQKQHKEVTGTMFKNKLVPKTMSAQTFYKVVKQLFLSRRISRRKKGKDFIYKVLRF